MKTMLVAIDFTANDSKVIQYAVQLGNAFNANLVLVHVLADASLYSVEYGPVEGFTNFNITNSLLVSEEIKQNSISKMEALMNDVSYSNLSYQILEGNIAEAMLGYALEANADLIIVGAHQHSGLFRLINGETSVKLVHESNVPLFIVPESPAEEEI